MSAVYKTRRVFVRIPREVGERVTGCRWSSDELRMGETWQQRVSNDPPHDPLPEPVEWVTCSVAGGSHGFLLADVELLKERGADGRMHEVTVLEPIHLSVVAGHGPKAGELRATCSLCSSCLSVSTVQQQRPLTLGTLVEAMLSHMLAVHPERVDAARPS